MDNRELQRVRHNYGIDGDYILSVGSIQPRKNLARLVRAYASLRESGSAAKLPKLVLVGKCAWLYDETLRALDETNIKDACGFDRIRAGNGSPRAIFRGIMFRLPVVL
jgi:glycosyltransferase involved in cell wall biosynthesis